jgi:hypothetical protein
MALPYERMDRSQSFGVTIQVPEAEDRWSGVRPGGISGGCRECCGKPPAGEVSCRQSYGELGALVALQAQRIAGLGALVAELRARLDQNSRNSSEPPSSDGACERAGARKRSLRRRSGRKPGGQRGLRVTICSGVRIPTTRCCTR